MGGKQEESKESRGSDHFIVPTLQRGDAALDTPASCSFRARIQSMRESEQGSRSGSAEWLPTSPFSVNRCGCTFMSRVTASLRGAGKKGQRPLFIVPSLQRGNAALDAPASCLFRKTRDTLPINHLARFFSEGERAEQQVKLRVVHRLRANGACLLFAVRLSGGVPGRTPTHRRRNPC